MKNLALCFLFVIGNLARALILEDYPLGESDPQGSTGFNWDYVVNFNNSSAVAINPRWLLTARHVADDAGNSSVIVNGVTYNQISEVYHSAANDPNNTTDADLALVELDQNLPGFYDIYTGGYTTTGGGPPQRVDAIMSGFGQTGTIDADGTGYQNNGGGRGTRRWGTNKVDRTDSQTVNWGSFTTTSNGIELDFDITDSDNEAGGGTGDSGGGVFVQSGSNWQLAGIMSTIVNTDGDNGVDQTFAVNVQQYEDWIVSVIPEPSTWILAGGFLGFLGAALRFRRR